MIISFFEEYPTKENLAKLKLVSFPTKLYIAAESLDAFYKIKDRIKSRNVKEAIYWPLLKKEEGYWMSPFAERKALKRVIEETINVPLLWDAEIPRKRILMLKNVLFFHKNKKMIKDFLSSHKKDVYCAEYYPETGIHYLLLKALGLEFSAKEYGNYEIKMLYSSMHHFSEEFMKKEIEKCVDDSGGKFIPAFGTLGIGARGDEKKIPLEILERDLSIAKDAGVKEAVIFRLGGLTKEYAALLKKYSK
ncbi:MAG: hypothetical protein PHO02_06540 [Candidatus Nanoarchaeia archaeon]|nr:hypothetical protein [Candidatus Nanoarchaeia archaeon]